MGSDVLPEAEGVPSSSQDIAAQPPQDDVGSGAATTALKTETDATAMDVEGEKKDANTNEEAPATQGDSGEKPGPGDAKDDAKSTTVEETREEPQLPAITHQQHKSMMAQYLAKRNQQTTFLRAKHPAPALKSDTDRPLPEPVPIGEFDSMKDLETIDTLGSQMYEPYAVHQLHPDVPLKRVMNPDQVPSRSSPPVLHVKGIAITVPDYFESVRPDGYTYDLNISSEFGRAYSLGPGKRTRAIQPAEPTPRLLLAEQRYREALKEEADEAASERQAARGSHKRPNAKKVFAADTPFAKIWSHVAREARKLGKRRRERLRGGYALLRNQANYVQREVRKRARHDLKLQRDMVSHNRKVVREMQKFWSRHEKEMAERQKQADRRAALERKKEEEERESLRQRRKLNFLLTQTELFSHFIASKMGTVQSGDSAKPVKDLSAIDASQAKAQADSMDFDEDVDESVVQEKAAAAARLILEKHQGTVDGFDASYSKAQQVSQGASKESKPAVPEDDGANGDSMLNPSTMPEALLHDQPRTLKATLKSYQLKGLNWLANLYDQGINGILADEMGLGKTIQSISLLLHLAEAKQIWGPFIVVSPVSTLHNWVNEIKKFAPSLVVLPYWGSVKDRKIIRQRWNQEKLYRKDAPWHVVVTSYQLAVSDMVYFKKLKWQYMVLDEAQALKSSYSQRWQTLLKFKCRNRLLLTGTPIQNSMAELWALLHFIMPSLFDSHDEFNEWFSKDIESKSQNADSDLNKTQVSRLHMILKPFMLRRVKKDVENEMPPKVEVEIGCQLAPRQLEFYRTIRNKIPITELLSNSSMSEATKTERLMNLVMQFRKVCNHPDIFERRDTRSPFAMVSHGTSLNPAFETANGRFAQPTMVVYAGAVRKGAVEYAMPRLLVDDNLTFEDGQGYDPGRQKWLECHLNIFAAHYVYHSLFNGGKSGVDGHDPTHAFDPLSMASPIPDQSDCFAFTRLISLSPRDVMTAAMAPMAVRFLDQLVSRQAGVYSVDASFQADDTRVSLFVTHPDLTLVSQVTSYRERLQSGYGLVSRLHAYYPAATSVPVNLVCSRIRVMTRHDSFLFDPVVKVAMLGDRGDDGHAKSTLKMNRGESSPVLSLSGALRAMYAQPSPSRGPALGLFSPVTDLVPTSDIFVPNMGNLMADSGKLRVLDQLLTKLKRGGHRVLIYSQMTKMIDILQDFMDYRKHRHLRLDGGSSLADRRDMVDDFQTDPDIFVFLLSTRAGGLGINLIAADTVIFYDSDWNPTMDAQAMDRAHRLGQTRQVTVYRLVTRKTVEEKILKRAKEKHEIQNIVISGGDFKQDVFRKEDVVSLLLDEDEVPGVSTQSLSADDGEDGVVVDLDADVVVQSPRKKAKHVEVSSSEPQGNGKRPRSDNADAPSAKRPR